MTKELTNFECFRDFINTIEDYNVAYIGYNPFDDERVQFIFSIIELYIQRVWDDIDELYKLGYQEINPDQEGYIYNYKNNSSCVYIEANDNNSFLYEVLNCKNPVVQKKSEELFNKIKHFKAIDFADILNYTYNKSQAMRPLLEQVRVSCPERQIT